MVAKTPPLCWRPLKDNAHTSSYVKPLSPPLAPILSSRVSPKSSRTAVASRRVASIDEFALLSTLIPLDNGAKLSTPVPGQRRGAPTQIFEVGGEWNS
ncbi:hypothetical protein ON010_g9051 [Phytophthora cinnamomi]|nr:hypothetical protein ON010_g9051 [Phytophthora cinnamomi]